MHTRVSEIRLWEEMKFSSLNNLPEKSTDCLLFSGEKKCPSPIMQREKCLNSSPAKKNAYFLCSLWRGSTCVLNVFWRSVLHGCDQDRSLWVSCLFSRPERRILK